MSFYHKLSLKRKDGEIILRRHLCDHVAIGLSHSPNQDKIQQAACNHNGFPKGNGFQYKDIVITGTYETVILLTTAASRKH